MKALKFILLASLLSSGIGAFASTSSKPLPCELASRQANANFEKQVIAEKLLAEANRKAQREYVEVQDSKITR